LRPILATIVDAGIREQVAFLNIQSQRELAATYRYFARLGSVFALTAYYEPFGLAPIEAAACGLVCIATENGGPSEIFEDGSGILVDPFDTDDIARGLQRGLENYQALAEKARQRVINKYTWEKTAEGYLSVIEQGIAVAHASTKPVPELDATGRISEYLDKNGEA
jgi:sucrose-phosphate synthase